MITANMAWVLSNFSGLKLQAIVFAQVNSADCLEWNNRIAQKEYCDKLESISPIRSRLSSEPDFLLSELLYGEISELTVCFSSLLESYLKTSLRLLMKRSDSLLRKGLKESDQKINPIDIADMSDMDMLRDKYIGFISDSICSGEMWNGKLKKYIRFLDLDMNFLNEGVNSRINSIWKMRNDISHSNSYSLSLNCDNTEYTYNHNVSVQEYTQFALYFVNLVDETSSFLSTLDEVSFQKWVK